MNGQARTVLSRAPWVRTPVAGYALLPKRLVGRQVCLELGGHVENGQAPGFCIYCDWVITTSG
jgi:hypothetical protein